MATGFRSSIASSVLGGSSSGSTNAGRLYVDVLPRTVNFNPALTSSMQGIQGRLAQSLHNSGRILTAAITVPFVTLMGVAYRSFTQLQSVQAQVDTQIQKTGGAAGVTSQHVTDMAKSIALATGNTEQYILQGEKILLTFTNIQNKGTGVNAIFDRATQVSEDLSVALGRDLVSASTAVGRALTKPSEAASQLRRVQATIPESVRQAATLLESQGKLAEAQKVILDQLEKQYGGLAAAAATPIQKMNAALSIMFNNIGSAMAGPVTGFIDFLSSIFTWLGNLPGPALKVAIVFGTIAASIGPLLYAVGSFNSEFTVLGRTLQGFHDVVDSIKLALFASGTGFITQFRYYQNANVATGFLDNLFGAFRQSGGILSTVMTGAAAKTAIASDNIGGLIGMMIKLRDWALKVTIAFQSDGLIAAISAFTEGIVSSFTAMAAWLAANPIVLVITALAAIGFAFFQASQQANQFREAVTSAADAIESGQTTFAQTVANWKATGAFQDNFSQQFLLGAKSTGEALLNLATGKWDQINPIDLQNQAETNATQQNQAAQARALRQQLNADATVSRLNDQLVAGTISFGQYREAALKAGVATSVVDLEISNYAASLIAAKTGTTALSDAFNYIGKFVPQIAAATGQSTSQISQSFHDMKNTVVADVNSQYNTWFQKNQQGLQQMTAQQRSEQILAEKRSLTEKSLTTNIANWEKQQLDNARNYYDQWKSDMLNFIHTTTDAVSTYLQGLSKPTDFTTGGFNTALEKTLKNTQQLGKDFNTIIDAVGKKKGDSLISYIQQAGLSLDQVNKIASETPDQLQKTADKTKAISNAQNSLANQLQRRLLGTMKDVASEIDRIGSLLASIFGRKWDLQINVPSSIVIPVVASSNASRGFTPGGKAAPAGQGWHGGWPTDLAYAHGGSLTATRDVLVGEYGPEIAKLPTGSWIYPTDQSQRILRDIGKQNAQEMANAQPSGNGGGSVSHEIVEFQITDWETGKGYMRMITRDEIDKENQYRSRRP